MLNTADINRITGQLKLFGCNQTEALIYLESLQAGPTTVLGLAKKLNFNRLTVNSAVTQLINKGLIYETRKGKKRLIAGEDPEVLKRILQSKYEDMKRTETNLNYVISLLHTIEPKNQTIPNVRFYEDIDGFKRMLEETLTAQGEILVFSYVDLLAKLVGADYLEGYFARRAKKNINSRLIFPPCSFADKVISKASEYKIQVRLLAPEVIWKSGMFIWNNNVALLSYTLSKLTCTIIENEDIAYFFKSLIFEMSWREAPKTA